MVIFGDSSSKVSFANWYHASHSPKFLSVHDIRKDKKSVEKVSFNERRMSRFVGIVLGRVEVQEVAGGESVAESLGGSRAVSTGGSEMFLKKGLVRCSQASDGRA